MKLPRLPADSFTWSRWRRFNLFQEFKIGARYSDIIRFNYVIQLYTVGYIEAQKLLCRPKKDCMAIMFLKDDQFSWCHLTKREFDEIFRT